jgi:hypothetical protein
VTWTLAYVIVVTAGPPLGSACAAWWVPPRRDWRFFYRGWITAGIAETVIALVSGQWPVMLAALAGTAVAVVAWWLSRRRRRRVPRAYGTKSKALVAALVRRAREAAVPRPVLRPVPEGA